MLSRRGYRKFLSLAFVIAFLTLGILYGASSTGQRLLWLFALNTAFPDEVFASKQAIRDSVVAFNLSVSNEVLAKAADEQFVSFDANDKAESCGGSGIEQLCKYQYSLSFIRSEKTNIAHTNDVLSVVIPVRMSGSIKLSDIWDVMQSTYSVNGEFLVDVRVEPTLTREWCLDWSAQALIDWKKRPDIDIAWVRVDIASRVEEKINELLKSERWAPVKKIVCEKIRDQVAQLWRLHSIPIAPNNSDPYFLNVNPVSVAYFGPTTREKKIQVGLYLTAKAYVTQTMELGEPRPFPPISKMQTIPGQIFVELPLQLSMADLRREINSRFSSVEIPSLFLPGHLMLTKEGLALSVSGKTLRSRVDFRITHDSLPFSATGVINVQGDLQVDRRAHELSLENTEVEIFFDSRLLRSLSTPFLPKLERLVKERLVSQARYNVKEGFDSVVRLLREETEKARDLYQFRMALKLDNTQYVLHDVRTRQDEIWVFANASANISGELTKISVISPGGGPQEPRIAPVCTRGRFKLVDAEELNIRSEAGRLDDDNVLGKIPKEAVDVEVHECKPLPRYADPWCLVTYRGVKGWATKKFLKACV